MKIETFTGPNLPDLFTQARSQIGPHAVLLGVRRLDRRGRLFEVSATAPPEAATESTPTLLTPGPAVAAPAAAPGLRHRKRVAARPFVLALVGPTGAGKTTTAAKLAMHEQAFGDRRVGFIALDTYRVGAIEQLTAFAELADAPVAVAYRSSDIPRIMRRLRHRDVLIVDTPGRGPREREDEAAVRECLEALHADEMHLTLPAGLPPGVLRLLVSRTRALGVTHILPTKVDEYPADDAAFVVSGLSRLPIRWIADGQRVPRDLRPAPAGRPDFAAPAFDLALAGN